MHKKECPKPTLWTRVVDSVEKRNTSHFLAYDLRSLNNIQFVNRTFELLRIVYASWCARNCHYAFLSIESFKYNIIFRRRYDTYSACTQLKHVYYICVCHVIGRENDLLRRKRDFEHVPIYIYVRIRRRAPIILLL